LEKIVLEKYADGTKIYWIIFFWNHILKYISNLYYSDQNKFQLNKIPVSDKYNSENIYSKVLLTFLPIIFQLNIVLQPTQKTVCILYMIHINRSL